MLAQTLSFDLPVILIVRCLSELPRKESTDAQWLLGRTLLDQLVKRLTDGQRKPGRPTRAHDHAFIAAHVEWRFSHSEAKLEDILQRTATLFRKPGYRTLYRWYRGGKGEASSARAAGRKAIEFFEEIHEVANEMGTEWMPESYLEFTKQRR
jgi:hypothetical protein